MGTLADIELRELRTFLVLADELHFGRTAERAGISQPSVSEAIRLLEHRIGARLFERTSRSVRLTPVGTDLRQRLAPALEMLDRALAGTHEAVRGLAQFERDNIVLVPIHDLPPVPLGLIWRTAGEDARIRALAEVARCAGPWPVTTDAYPAPYPAVDERARPTLGLKKRGTHHAG